MVSVFWYYCWTANGQKSSKHRSDKFWPNSQAPRAQKLKGAAIGILSARNWHVSSMVKHEIGEWTEKIVSKYTYISEVDAFGGSATISRINQIERQRERDEYHPFKFARTLYECREDGGITLGELSPKTNNYCTSRKTILSSWGEWESCD